MKLRCLLVCLAILISLVFYLQLPKQDQKTQATFSPVAANPTNQIDISKLTLTDYNHIFEKHNVVFISRDNSQKQVYFDDKHLQSLEMSPSQKQAAFYYDPNETDERKESKLSLMIFDLTNKSVKEVFHTAHPSWDVRSDLHWLGAADGYWITISMDIASIRKNPAFKIKQLFSQFFKLHHGKSLYHIEGNRQYNGNHP